MNRLLLTRFYLVGPMDHDREAGRQWRLDIGKFLRSRGAIALNPYDKPISNGEALENDDFYEERQLAMKEGRYDDVSRLMKAVRNADLGMVDGSNTIICHLDMEKRPCGTIEEIVLANREKKPIIIHCPQGKKEIPPWLFGMLPHKLFFDNWEDVKGYLEHVDTAEEIDYLGRWRFFNLYQVTRDIIREKQSQITEKHGENAD